LLESATPSRCAIQQIKKHISEDENKKLFLKKKKISLTKLPDLIRRDVGVDQCAERLALFLVQLAVGLGNFGDDTRREERPLLLGRRRRAENKKNTPPKSRVSATTKSIF
jgi:hypothetical protein